MEAHVTGRVSMVQKSPDCCFEFLLSAQGGTFLVEHSYICAWNAGVWSCTDSVSIDGGSLERSHAYSTCKPPGQS